MIAALLLGAIGSFVGIQLAGLDDPKQITNQDQTQQNENGLTTEKQQELIDNMQSVDELSKISQAYQLIQDQYVQKIDDNKLIEGAIQGMLDSLDDPYSVYMDKETVEEFTHQIESSFEGIGAEVSMVEGKLTIIAPIKDSPAEAAGLMPNDQILKVDNETLTGLDLYEAVSKIRGEQGTKVSLEVQRPGVEESITVELVRDDIPVETVYSETTTVDGKKAGIIEITSFSEQTAQRFQEELNKLEEQGIAGLVIDVRGNPGGLLPVVQDILKLFITKDTPYLQIEDRDGEKSRYFSELENKKDYPISVLINEGSASASEILAVSMKEAGDYEVVGTTSFGKGTVQQTKPMGDGSTIKLTRFKWLSPDGNWIHEKGVEPTIQVEQPEYYYTNPIQFNEEQDSLAYNQSSDKIKNVQIILKGLGYDPEREDGYFSESTTQAVEAFQKANELPVTGEVDVETAEKLEVNIIEQIRSGEHDNQKAKALEVLFK